jgi:hypothetical protein
MIGTRSHAITAIALAAGVLAAGAPAAVTAQEAIATATDAPLGGAPTPQPTATPDPYHRLAGGGPDVMRNVNACGAPPKDDGSKDKDPHGEVFAAVGTRGYREAGGVVCVPIGDHVSATIAVQAGQYPGWRWRH